MPNVVWDEEEMRLKSVIFVIYGLFECAQICAALQKLLM